MTTYIGQSETMQHMLAVLRAARKSGVPVYLTGAPGVGKTALIRALAEESGEALHILIGSTMDPIELSGLPVLTTLPGSDEPVARNTAPHWAADLRNKGKGILFLDELTTAPPAVQAAMLTLLQGRTVGEYKLPDDVFIIAAGNPPEVAADGQELAAPLANRLIHIEYTPDKEDWFTGMALAWGNPNISDEERGWRNLITAFLRSQPNLTNAMPDGEAAGGAWPSFRSWDNAAKTLGCLPPSEKAAANMILTGLVGADAALTFSTWHRNLKLPNYKEIIASPERFKWENFSVDQVYAILSIVVDNINDKNVPASINVFEVAADKGVREDIVLAFQYPLIEKVKTIDLKGNRESLLRLFTKFGAAFKAAQLV